MIHFSEESQICKHAVETFSKDRQILMFIEECGELFQAISKNNRGMEANIAEEIADVEIMLEQIKHIFKCHGEVNKWKNKKIVRLCHRVEKFKKIG